MDSKIQHRINMLKALFAKSRGLDTSDGIHYDETRGVLYFEVSVDLSLSDLTRMKKKVQGKDIIVGPTDYGVSHVTIKL